MRVCVHTNGSRHLKEGVCLEYIVLYVSAVRKNMRHFDEEEVQELVDQILEISAKICTIRL